MKLFLPAIAWLVVLCNSAAAQDSTTRPASGPGLPPLPSAIEVESDIAVDELRILLRPLDVEEFEPVVAEWMGRLRDKAEQVARARLAARQSSGDERDRFNQIAAQLEVERADLRNRVEYVLEAYDDRGGDADPHRKYLGAVTKTDIDVADLSALTDQAYAWAISPSGGIAVVLNILWFFLTLILAFVLSRVLRRITRRAVGRLHRTSQLLKDFLAGIVAKITMLIGVVIGISFLGVNIGPLVAAIGAAGLVVGLALQGTLSNFASGIMILLYRPYDIGDSVNAGGVSGKVAAMSLVSTTIVTFDNQRIIVPNNNIWGDVITNLTGLDTRRVDMTFGVAYDDDLDHVMNVLKAVCDEHPLVLKDPEPLIKVVGHGDSSVNVTCRPWTRTPDYWSVYWDFHKLVKQRFDAADITIPFPQRDVHVHQSVPVA